MRWYKMQRIYRTLLETYVVKRSDREGVFLYDLICVNSDLMLWEVRKFVKRYEDYFFTEFHGLSLTFLSDTEDGGFCSELIKKGEEVRFVGQRWPFGTLYSEYDYTSSMDMPEFMKQEDIKQLFISAIRSEKVRIESFLAIRDLAGVWDMDLKDSFEAAYEEFTDGIHDVFAQRLFQTNSAA